MTSIFIIICFASIVVGFYLATSVNKQQKIRSRLINQWSKGNGQFEKDPLYQTANAMLCSKQNSTVSISVSEKGDIEYITVDVVDPELLAVKIGNEIYTVKCDLAKEESMFAKLEHVAKKAAYIRRSKVVATLGSFKCA